jgi:hypothetical protein
MVNLDRIILGDNQFFGINHMSEDKAQAQSERFKDISEIIEVIDTAYDCGIHAFMFNTHERVSPICDHFRNNPSRYTDLRLYPSMPYAHKYANAVNEKGIINALNDFLFVDKSAGQALSTIIRGGLGVVSRDMLEIMRLLVDAEMHMFRGLNVKAVFLQNIVSDMLLGLGSRQIFIEFSKYVRSKYGVDAAFNTMNMPLMVEFLLDCGIENPIVCSSFNKIGYLMSPSKEAYEKTLRERTFRGMAMSILASGAINPEAAVKYVTSFGKINSVVFGASSRSNIMVTKNLLDHYWSSYLP